MARHDVSLTDDTSAHVGIISRLHRHGLHETNQTCGNCLPSVGEARDEGGSNEPGRNQRDERLRGQAPGRLSAGRGARMTPPMVSPTGREAEVPHTETQHLWGDWTREGRVGGAGAPGT